MNELNLLILGAGQYGAVTKELATQTGLFSKIDFLDDNSDKAIGRIDELGNFLSKYTNAIVAVGNSDFRLDTLSKLKECGYSIPSLISPLSYVSPSAIIGEGCIIEPFAVIQTGALVKRGCIISSGAVVNHNAVIEEGCHIDVNAIVKANARVESRTKVI